MVDAETSANLKFALTPDCSNFPLSNTTPVASTFATGNPTFMSEPKDLHFNKDALIPLTLAEADGILSDVLKPVCSDTTISLSQPTKEREADDGSIPHLSVVALCSHIFDFDFLTTTKKNKQEVKINDNKNRLCIALYAMNYQRSR